MKTNVLLSSDLGGEKFSVVIGRYALAIWNNRAYITPSSTMSIEKLEEYVSKEYSDVTDMTFVILSESSNYLSYAQLKSLHKRGEIHSIYFVSPKGDGSYQSQLVTFDD